MDGPYYQHEVLEFRVLAVSHSRVLAKTSPIYPLLDTDHIQVSIYRPIKYPYTSTNVYQLHVCSHTLHKIVC